jgi:hypothetical protein
VSVQVRLHRIALAVLAAVLCLPACSSRATAPRDATALVGDAPASATALFFPARWRPPRRAPIPVLLVGPELVDHRVLYDHDGALIPFLIDRGYPVLLVDAANGPLPDEFGTDGLLRFVDELRRRTATDEILVGGVGPGGRHALRLVEALERRRDGDRGVHVRKLFFVGTGLDYAYPEPFFARLDQDGLKGPDLHAECSDPAKRAVCTRFFRSSVRPKGYVDLLRFRPANAPTGGDLGFVADMRVPALFVVGKTDNVSPVESVVPVYRAYGSKASGVAKRYFVAGLENGLMHDYDELSLFLGSSAESDVYSVIGAWLDD